MSKKEGRKIQEKGEFMKKETVRLADGRYLIFYDFTPLPEKRVQHSVERGND